MDQILSKLSQIEQTAQGILDHAESSRQALSEEAEKKCKDFDDRLNEETSQRLQEIRSELEQEKDSQLSALRADTEASFSALDAYYEENHRRLSEVLFQKILDS